MLKQRQGLLQNTRVSSFASHENFFNIIRILDVERFQFTSVSNIVLVFYWKFGLNVFQCFLHGCAVCAVFCSVTVLFSPSEGKMKRVKMQIKQKLEGRFFLLLFPFLTVSYVGIIWMKTIKMVFTMMELCIKSLESQWLSI